MQSGSYRLDIDPLTGELRYYDLLGSSKTAEQTEVKLPKVERATSVSLIGDVYINEKIAEVFKIIGFFFTSFATFMFLLDDLFDSQIAWTTIILGTETAFELLSKIVREILKYRIIIQKKEESKKENENPPQAITDEDMNRVDAIEPMSDEDASEPQLADLVTETGIVIGTVELPRDRNYEDLQPPTVPPEPEPDIPSMPDEPTPPYEDWTEPAEDEKEEKEQELLPEEESPAARLRDQRLIWME